MPNITQGCATPPQLNDGPQVSDDRAACSALGLGRQRDEGTSPDYRPYLGGPSPRDGLVVVLMGCGARAHRLRVAHLCLEWGRPCLPPTSLSLSFREPLQFGF